MILWIVDKVNLYIQFAWVDSMEDEDVIFEEQEVVWAKIRGYPWWPAYIHLVHQTKDGDDEFTVVFFGDNTNARLDSGKLRKFIENYVECYVKAKTNRKLMTSIMMAEEKLKQNDQNVSIFEQLRGRIKDTKKAKGRLKDINQSLSHMFESGDHKGPEKPSEQQISQQPEQPQPKARLIEPRTRGRGRRGGKKTTQVGETSTGRRRQHKMEVQDSDSGEQKAQQIVKQQQEVVVAAPGPGQGLMKQQTRRKPSITRQVDIVIDLKSLQRSPASQPAPPISPVEPKQLNQTDANKVIIIKKGRPKAKEKAIILKSESQSRRGKDDQQFYEDSNQVDNECVKVEAEQMDVEKSQLPEGLVRNKTDPEPSKASRKRRKRMEIADYDEQSRNNEDNNKMEPEVVQRNVRSYSTGQDPVKSHRQVVPARKRGRPKKVQVMQQLSSEQQYQSVQKSEPLAKKKLIRKQNLGARIVQKPKGMSIADQAVVAGVRGLLEDREGLIDFLARATITVDNVKEILDLDVSNILQEGNITDHVINLLELLRAALLFKYFPDDVKHKKKYQKLIKKRTIEPEEEEEKELSKEKVQLRKKTLLKVRKFLTPNTLESEEQLQKISQKIQQQIFAGDNGVGQQYCKIAFLVLSALKEKRQSHEEVIKKLQGRVYE